MAIWVEIGGGGGTPRCGMYGSATGGRWEGRKTDNTVEAIGFRASGHGGDRPELRSVLDKVGLG